MSANFSLVAGVDNYCVAGNPVSHSKSPLIQQAFARQTGEAMHYQKIEVPLDGFEAFLDDFFDAGGKGLNVTLPFKRQACAAVDERTQRSVRCGAVNTIWIDAKGTRHGDTTDGRGLVGDLRNHAVDLAGKQVLLLGAGGAARGVIPDLFAAGCAGVLIANRTEARARLIVSELSDYAGLSCLGPHEPVDRDIDVLINGTAASLQGELPAIPPGLDLQGRVAYDMAYGDTETVFVAWARRMGAALALDGLGMLVEQAAESFRIWRGVRPQTTAVIELLRRG